MTDLTADAVSAAFRDCLFKPNEIANGAPVDASKVVKVDGVTNSFGLHRDRLEAHRSDVAGWIGDLPAEFLRSGGGWSFLNLCQTRDGDQWTGMQSAAQELCVLAIGLGLAQWLLPREMWPALPGGVPYVAFDPSGFDEQAAA